MDKIKVMLADRREILRQGLAKILAEEPNIHLVATCSCGLEAVDKVGELKPDVILLDTELPDCSYTEVTRRIHEVSPQTQIIILTHSETAENLFSALRMGARAYASKDIRVEDLTKMIALVHQGKVVVSSPMAVTLLDHFSRFTQPHDVEGGKHEFNLSSREIEVLTFVAKGNSNQEIANSLFITENTVKVHLHRIMQKLQVHNRQRAVALLMEKGMTPQVTNTDQQQV